MENGEGDADWRRSMSTEKTQGGMHFLKLNEVTGKSITTEMVSVKSNIQEHNSVFLIGNQRRIFGT